MKKWPNFFIVGVSKAGTTSLYNYLNNNSQIFMSPIKEPHYFSRNAIPDNHFQKPIRNKEQYLNLFENVKNEKIIGDASASALSDPDAPKLIHNVSPQAKILISLRDPAERAYSAYLMPLSHNKINKTFQKQLNYDLNHIVDLSKPGMRLHQGFYYDHLKKYLEIFDKKQVKIIIFEEWIKNPKETIKSILNFLDLENTNESFDEKIYNKYTPKKIPRGNIAKFFLNRGTKSNLKKILPITTRKYIGNKILKKSDDYKPEMTMKERRILIDLYKEDVKKLEKLLDRKLPWQNFS